MTDYKKLYDGISKAAWGYFFLYFNFNLGTINIIPGFVGYLLFLSAIKLLEDEERELSLLSTLCIILTVWAVIEWLGQAFGLQVEGMWQFIDIVICLVNLYFHFQLLTNMASIAVKHQSYGHDLNTKILKYRTLQTVMLTGIQVITYLQPWLPNGVWVFVSFGMVFIFVVACICIMKVLFSLRNSLVINQI